MTAELGTDSPTVLETLSKTDFRNEFGQLTHDVCEGRLVLRIHDQYGRVFYVTREVPESVRELVEAEPPLRFAAEPGHRARARRPAAEVLAPLAQEEIARRYGVRNRTAREWSLWARKQRGHAIRSGHAHA